MCVSVSVCVCLSVSLCVSLPVCVCPVHGHDGVVLASEYITGQNYLATSSTDLTVKFWDCNSFTLRQQMPTPDVQTALLWNQPYQRLYSASINGIVSVWDSKTLERKKVLKGHKDVVMDLHAIESLDVVASASLDGTIRLWDQATMSDGKELTYQGAKGVLSLAYKPAYRALISAGFDHDAVVWNPYVQKDVV